MFTNKTYNNIVLKSIVIAEEKISDIRENISPLKDKIVSFTKKIIATVEEKINNIKETVLSYVWMAKTVLA